MAQGKDETLKPASELNWFDIKVIFDGKQLSPSIPEPLERQYDEAEDGDLNGDVTATRVYGKWVPVLLFNTMVIPAHMIDRYTLYYDSFAPYMYLILRDPSGILQTKNVPGYANIITLIMLPHADDKYKGIKLSFYISNISYRGEYIICNCDFRYVELEKQHTEQLVFHWPSDGCSTDHVNGVDTTSNEITDCPLQPNNHPNTYELLHVIAEETGLGFAATDQCASVRDDKHRILHKEKYADTIQKHVEFGGTDEDNIFDSWIDLYGYITLVNVPWVMSRKIDFNNLAMHAEIGIGMTSSALPENETTPLTHRMLTNERVKIPSNMTIDWYENMVDNNSIIYSGSQNTYYDLNPMGASGANDMSIKGIQTIENSIDGQKLVDRYRFDDTQYRGAEMGTVDDNNFPEIHQKSIHNKYFARLRSKRLKVKMTVLNFGLMRGTLVGLSWFERDYMKKRFIQANIGNAFNENKEVEQPITMDDVWDVDLDPSVPMINPFISGLYYIDGMVFEYESSSNTFSQYLILIKKDDEKPDMLSSGDNIETKPKVNVNKK